MDLVDLAGRAARQLPGGAGYVQPLPKLGVFQQARASAFEAAIFEPVLVVVLQGRKETLLGADSYPMGPGDCLLVSHDLPVVARVTKAPYLAVLFDLELGVLRSLFDELPEPTAPSRALSAQRCDAAILDALGRYLELAGSPGAAVLGPLIVRELHYRIATAPFGGTLCARVRHDSHATAVARAIAIVRRDFRTPIEIPELARRVGLSPSAFHEHFKRVTASSPLQYQKELRLLEARRLLRGGAPSVAAAAFDVGYESPTQFSREYTRKFGTPPKHDLPAPRAR